VVGFPMGYSSIPAKVEEVKKAIDEGADELDMVVNISAIKSGHWSYIRNEIDSVIRAVAIKGKVMKLIVETGLLTRDELKLLLPIAEANDVHFIKTSTGFNGDGATVETVKFLRQNLRPNIKIKASGGIKSFEVAERMIQAGANRIGSSSSVNIALHSTK
jgi:deoxyribose-phosphate aldolase